jgi:hypothetical protein
MTERSEVVSHLSIKGFTLNPLKSEHLARNLLNGLGTTYILITLKELFQDQ